MIVASGSATGSFDGKRLNRMPLPSGCQLALMSKWSLVICSTAEPSASITQIDIDVFSGRENTMRCLSGDHRGNRPSVMGRSSPLAGSRARIR